AGPPHEGRVDQLGDGRGAGEQRADGGAVGGQRGTEPGALVRRLPGPGDGEPGAGDVELGAGREARLRRSEYLTGAGRLTGDGDPVRGWLGEDDAGLLPGDLRADRFGPQRAGHGGLLPEQRGDRRADG